jgi:hypothetical protein
MLDHVGFAGADSAKNRRCRRPVRLVVARARVHNLPTGPGELAWQLRSSVGVKSCSRWQRF